MSNIVLEIFGAFRVVINNTKDDDVSSQQLLFSHLLFVQFFLYCVLNSLLHNPKGSEDTEEILTPSRW